MGAMCGKQEAKKPVYEGKPPDWELLVKIHVALLAENPEVAKGGEKAINEAATARVGQLKDAWGKREEAAKGGATAVSYYSLRLPEKGKGMIMGDEGKMVAVDANESPDDHKARYEGAVAGCHSYYEMAQQIQFFGKTRCEMAIAKDRVMFWENFGCPDTMEIHIAFCLPAYATQMAANGMVNDCLDGTCPMKDVDWWKASLIPWAEKPDQVRVVGYEDLFLSGI